MKIAVIDDEKQARLELCYQIETILPNAEIRTAASGAQGLQLAMETAFDLVFLDIRLGDMMGTEVAELVRARHANTYLVFTSAFPEVGRGYLGRVVDDYILKPFDSQRVRQVIARCQSTPHPTVELATQQKLTITVNRHSVQLNVTDILYVETIERGRHSVLHTATEHYTTTATLGDYEGRLQSYGFFRTHKGCLVQMAKITDTFLWENNGYGLRLEGVERILPVGRDQMRRLRMLLTEV